MLLATRYESTLLSLPLTTYFLLSTRSILLTTHYSLHTTYYFLLSTRSIREGAASALSSTSASPTSTSPTSASRAPDARLPSSTGLRVRDAGLEVRLAAGFREAGEGGEELSAGAQGDERRVPLCCLHRMPMRSSS